MMQDEAVRLRLSESRLRVVLSLATPPLLVLMAWGALLVEAPVLVTAALAALAAFLGYVAVFDFPIAIEVDSRGIHRVCLLGRQLLPWEDVAGIVQPHKRGLVLVTKDRKRRVLVDRALGEGELDLVRAQARLRDVQIGF